MWLIFAAGAAVCFGVRGILYHWASQRGLDRNLMLFGVFMLGALASLAGSVITGQQWTSAAATGLLMGLFSFAANASIFKGFAVGKSSVVAILSGMPAVVVVLLTYLFWGEKLTSGQLFSFVCIVAGILLVRYSNDLRRGNLQGAQWGLLAMLFFAFNDTTGKLSTRLGADLLPTLFLMFMFGAVCFGAWWMMDGKRRGRGTASPGRDEDPKTGTVWTQRKTFFAGMVIGFTNFGGMMLIVTAFKSGITGLVSAVVSMSVLVILLYTQLFLKERLRPIEWMGMAASIVGIVTLRLF